MMVYILSAGFFIVLVLCFFIYIREMKLRNLLKSLNHPIIVINRKNKIFLATPSATDLLGLKLSEIGKISAEEAVSRLNSAEMNQVLQHFLQDNNLITPQSMIIHPRFTDEFLADITSIAGFRNSPLLLISLTRLTQNRLALMNSKTNTIIGARIHDMKTNLSTNQMALSNIQYILGEETEDIQQVKEFLSAAEDAMKESVRNCTEISYLTHNGAVYFRLTDFQTLIRSVLDEEDTTTQVHCEFEESIPPMLLDENAMRYVIRKLLQFVKSESRDNIKIQLIKIQETINGLPVNNLVQFEFIPETNTVISAALSDSFDFTGGISLKKAHNDVLLISSILRNHGSDFYRIMKPGGVMAFTFYLSLPEDLKG